MQATQSAKYENSGWMPDVLDTEGVRVIPDVEAEPRFKRTEAVRDAGLRSMVILPINVDGQVPAYLEFFSEEVVEPRQAMLDVMTCVAALVGQLIQRRMLNKAVSNSIWLMQQRVGRELHDNVCQDLVGLAYLGRELAASLTCEGHPRAETARAMVNDIDTCLDRARAISKGLCPFDCKADELCQALGDLVDASRRRFKMDFALNCPDTLVLANNEQAQQLYYIAHEALTNVVKHSDARLVHIELSVERGLLRMRIQDDGAGMLRDQDTSSGIGIRAMRHRAETIGAKLEIESDTNRGTVLTCTLPL